MRQLSRCLQREPNLPPVRTRCDIGAERAGLRDASDDLARTDIEYGHDRVERRSDVSEAPARRKYRHAGTAGGLKARNFGERSHLENGHIILAAHSHPDFSAVAREVRLMQRAADVRRVLDGVGRSIDERHGIPTDRDDYKRRPVA